MQQSRDDLAITQDRPSEPLFHMYSMTKYVLDWNCFLKEIVDYRYRISDVFFCYVIFEDMVESKEK